jgi:hypothetical protein
VPLGLRGLLQTIFVLASGQTLGSPGLAGFAPAGSVLLTTLLGGVDLFILWRLALLALGVSAASELSGSKALLATAGVWLVFAVLRLLLAFVGSAVGQQLAAA